MREDICTIPINEVFEKGDGCPICRMKNMLTERIVDYILGPAMMEPDIRIKTNTLGFCSEHFENMMNKRNKLQLALMLESHLAQIEQDVFKKGMFGMNAKKSIYSASRLEETCFVCEGVEQGMNSLLKTLFITYKNEFDFRELYRKQDFICLPHYRLLLNEAQSQLDKKIFAKFFEDTTELCKSKLESLYDDVHSFTQLFDYRSNAGVGEAPKENVKMAIENTYKFLNAKQGEDQ